MQNLTDSEYFDTGMPVQESILMKKFQNIINTKNLTPRSLRSQGSFWGACIRSCLMPHRLFCKSVCSCKGT